MGFSGLLPRILDYGSKDYSELKEANSPQTHAYAAWAPPLVSSNVSNLLVNKCSWTVKEE